MFSVYHKWFVIEINWDRIVWDVVEHGLFWRVCSFVLQHGRSRDWVDGEMYYDDAPTRYDLGPLHVFSDDRACWLYCGKRMLMVW